MSTTPKGQAAAPPTGTAAPAPPAPSRRLPRWVGPVLGVAVLLAYNNWLAWRLNGSPDALRGYLSELAASDQPYYWFFRTFDLTSAALFCLIALLGRTRWQAWLGRWTRWATASLTLVGVATALDVVFAMPCSESRDPTCHLVGTANWYLHGATSISVGLGFFGLFSFTALGLASHLGWRRRALVLGGLGCVIGCLNLVSGFGPFLWPGIQGWVQPPQVVICSLLVALMAWGLTRPPRHRAATDRGVTDHGDAQHLPVTAGAEVTGAATPAVDGAVDPRRDASTGRDTHDAAARARGAR